MAYVTSWTRVVPDPTVMTHINYAFGHVNEQFNGVRIDNEQRLRDMHIEYVKPQIELDERYFFDNVHLTMPGAKLFTADLFRLLAP